MHHLNLSDHTHITLSVKVYSDYFLKNNSKQETPQTTNSKIKLGKCDLNEYHLCENSLHKDSPTDLKSNMDVDLGLLKITNTLFKASSIAIKQRKPKKSTRSGLPVWNDRIQMSVRERVSKPWKKASRPSDPNNTYSVTRYNLDVIRQSACLILNPITVYRHGFLFNCMAMGQASDSITALT